MSGYHELYDVAKLRCLSSDVSLFIELSSIYRFTITTQKTFRKAILYILLIHDSCKFLGHFIFVSFWLIITPLDTKFICFSWLTVTLMELPETFPKVECARNLFHSSTDGCVLQWWAKKLTDWQLTPASCNLISSSRCASFFKNLQVRTNVISDESIPV